MQAVADDTQNQSAPFRTQAGGVGREEGVQNLVPVFSSQVCHSLNSGMLPPQELLP